jgi:hypothetical protein
MTDLLAILVKVATQPSCLYLLGALWPEQT